MSSFTMTKRIEAEPRLVFEACTDFANLAQHISGITKVEVLSQGPVGVGTRFRETRIMFKNEATEEMLVTAFDPPGSFTLEANSCGSIYVSRHSFQADGNATLLSLRIESKPQTLFARVMSPLGWLMQGMMKKCIEQDLDDLKKAIEAKAQEKKTAAS